MSRLSRKVRETFNRSGVFCIVFLTVSTIALAQLPTVTILGTVQDSTGALVPDAAITVRNLDTGLARTGGSDAGGSYRFAALPVGSYEVRAEREGFRAEVRSGLTLAVGQEAVVNFALQVGAVEQTVEVTGEAPLVNTTSGSLGWLVNEQQVAELPLNGRNYVDLTLLQPGVVKFRPEGSGASSSGGTAFSANGAPIRSNQYMLDGAPVGLAQGTNSASSTGATLGIEGIREWRVLTNSSSAEYGMRMGAQMIMVSKGGTNLFHGSLFEYLRNSALDARNFFDYKTAEAPRRLPAFTRNQFGGSVGGPIQRDRVFFFATYEGLRQRLGLTTISDTIPPSAKVDGGLVPQISPTVRPLLTLYPDPNLSGNRFTFPATQPAREDYGQIRGDYNFSDNDAFFARFTIDDAELVNPQSFPQFTENNSNRYMYLTVSETHTFSPAMVGTFRFSFSQSKPDQLHASDISGPGFSFVEGQRIGELEVGGLSGMGSNAGGFGGDDQNIYTWSADLFYTRGRHTLKFGTLINRIDHHIGNGGNILGKVAFANLPSFLEGNPDVYTANVPGGQTTRDYVFYTPSFYVQDDYRALPNLTLNLGLRYEFHTDYKEVNGQGSALRDNQRDAEFTVGLPFKNPSRRNFGPRFGFAWDVMGDGNSSVRGGFGIMYELMNWVGMLSGAAPNTPPFGGRSRVTNPPPGSFMLPIEFPSGGGRTPESFDFNVQQPHMLHYNLTLERELPGNMAVTVAYAGSRGFNLATSVDGNPAFPTILSDGRKFWTGEEPRINPHWDSITYVTASTNSWYNSMQFTLRKRLSRGLQFESAYTWSKLLDEKQGMSGHDNGGSDDGFKYPEPTNRSARKGWADYSLAHNWRFNTIYRFSEIAGLNGVGGALLNGWWVSGILSAQTGTPMTLYVTSNRSRSQVGNVNRDLPHLLSGRNNDNIVSGTTAGCLGVAAGQKLGGPELYYDPCAFSIPAAGFLGTAGRNILFGPGLVNLDFSLVKDIPLRYLGEGGKLEFRTEFFNLLNRANFYRPGNSLFGAKEDVEAPLGGAGRIDGTATTSRQIQFALKVIW
jgi:hypothetical protein